MTAEETRCLAYSVDTVWNTGDFTCFVRRRQGIRDFEDVARMARLTVVFLKFECARRFRTPEAGLDGATMLPPQCLVFPVARHYGGFAGARMAETAVADNR